MPPALPFGATITPASGQDVLFLPTPRATLVHHKEGLTLLGPHGRLFIFRDDTLVTSLQPQIIKLIFGSVSQTINGGFTQTDLPNLGAFEEASNPDSMEQALIDARHSVQFLWDEELFAQWWSEGRNPDPQDRRLQRICQRYGGQSPKAIAQLHRLGLALQGYLAGSVDALVYFSDQSHFIRNVRDKTGYTPTQIRKMSVFFYFSDLYCH
jgi:hypothetical protein